MFCGRSPLSVLSQVVMELVGLGIKAHYDYDDAALVARFFALQIRSGIAATSVSSWVR